MLRKYLLGLWFAFAALVVVGGIYWTLSNVVLIPGLSSDLSAR